jgi:carbon monoxide dehydrogenase subunit G
MEITGEYRIQATQQAVWDALNDPAVLQRSLPGCQSLEQTGEHEFTAVVGAKVGPVSAIFRGKVELGDLDPPHGYTISGRGQGGPAGFAKGSANVSLQPDGEGTWLRYKANVEVGGKLASVGGRLIRNIAGSLAEDFFGRFSDNVTGRHRGGAEAPTPESLPLPASPQTGAAVAQGHIPLIDRCAWLLVGFAAGVAAALIFPR